MSEESRVSVDAYAVAGSDEVIAADKPGAFCFVEIEGVLHIWISVPSPWGALANKLPLNCPEGWIFDGNRERPTLSPSIHAVGAWHGWLRAGRLESC